MDVIWKSAIGAVVLAGVLLLSRTSVPYLAGLMLFFPALGLPAFYFIGVSEGPERLRGTIIAALLSMPLWGIWALAFYFLSYRFTMEQSALLSLVVWGVAASALVLIMNGRF